MSGAVRRKRPATAEEIPADLLDPGGLVPQGDASDPRSRLNVLLARLAEVDPTYALHDPIAFLIVRPEGTRLADVYGPGKGRPPLPTLT